MAAMFTPDVVLVDGSSYLYRAFHGLPPLQNSHGEPTGAIYGVLNMLRKLQQTYPSKFFAVIFDAPGKTFRDDWYPQYKANRKETPEDLRRQFDPLNECIQASGLPILMIPGCEADDVIGTLAKQAEQCGLKTLISTGDKDLAQLVNPHVCLVNTMTDTFLDDVAVKTKFGIPPNRIIDYLTLVGDSVDNVPGIDKVGPKTAVKWLQTYGDLETLITHAQEIPGKIGENLREGIPKLELSRRLVTIKTDVELPCTVNELVIKPHDLETLEQLFKRLEFRGWLQELQSKKTSIQSPHTYQTITTETQLQEWLQKINSADLVAFDTETDSLDVITAQLVGLSFSVEKNQAAYLPLQHNTTQPQLSLSYVLQQLKPWLENPSKKKVGQHIKFDTHILANYDISLNGIAYDTMLESYVLNSGNSRHDMDSLALKYLNHKTITYEEVTGKGAKQKNFREVAIDQATQYAAEDADITLQLHQSLWPLIEPLPELKDVFHHIEMPLIPVLMHMERRGVLIDVPKLNQQSQELAQRLEVLEQQAFTLADSTFNINSPKQLQAILYEKMNLPILERTATGQASTSESVLQELALSYELPKVILEYRSLSKLKATYTDQLPKQINSKTGRVHTSYNQAVTATGRLSSTDPNLQNIPVRTAEGRRIREAFIAPAGYKIISADYSQIELRLMAHLSQDPSLLKSFAQGLDVHQATAAEVFGIPLDQVTFEQRRRAKAINFGLIYGMSAFGLAKQINVSREAAGEYIQQYFARYPNVKRYMDNTRLKAHEQGYVETITGRRLYLLDINTSNMGRQRAAERAAINAPLQGSAAEIIKLAMIAIDEWLRTTNFPAYMIMQVHDELIFEVKEGYVTQAKEQIEKLMTKVVNLSVPLMVDIGVGTNWHEAHD